jgi:hypothetical protein
MDWRLRLLAPKAKTKMANLLHLDPTPAQQDTAKIPCETSPNQGALCQGVLDHETWRASFFNLVSRNGRDQPRHSVVRQPPGANRLDLIPTQPMDLIVRAKRRALPVVMGKSSRARRATVLVHVRLAGSARSSARLQGSSWPSDSSACARCNLPSSDMNASCGHLLPG